MRFTACVALLVITSCHRARPRDPDALSVTRAIEAGRALDGQRVKVAAIVHAISSTTSTQHPERSWAIQLVDSEDDYRAHRDHTLTCTVAARPEAHLHDEITVQGTARIGSAGHVVELVGCEP